MGGIIDDTAVIHGPDHFAYIGILIGLDFLQNLLDGITFCVMRKLMPSMTAVTLRVLPLPSIQQDLLTFSSERGTRW